MRILLFGTGYHCQLEPLAGYLPSPLLYIADKPIVFHVIEAAIVKGATEFHLLLHHFPEQIEQRLGNGKRWGIEIHYHLVKDPENPSPMINVISKKWGEDLVLVGRSDLLPDLSDMEADAPVLLYDKDSWTGWGAVPAHQLSKLPETDETIGKIAVNTILDCRSLDGLLEGNTQQISKERPDILFPTTAHQVEPGIWISRGAVIEPGAIILPPIFLGINSHIRSGATIGPRAIVERYSMVDNHSRVENSLVRQNSYIGEDLEIIDCIIDRNSLINLKHGTAILIQERHILSDTDMPPVGSYLFELLEKAGALLLLLLLSPIYLWLKATCMEKGKEVVQIPASESQHEWRTFTLKKFVPSTFFQRFFSRLPYLWEIVRGNLHFVGVAPRPLKQIEEMPEDWKAMYLRAKAGLITLTQLDHGKSATLDEQYASEAYYAMHMGIIFDCKLALRWFVKKLLGWT